MLDRARSPALTLHNEFQVPLEGTALTLGILGAVAGACIVFLLDTIGLGTDPIVVQTSFLLDLEPKGFVFTHWCWTRPAHWIPTVVIEFLLWSFMGVAISRTVISRVSENEPMGVRTALAFAARNFVNSVSFVCLIAGLLFMLSVPMIVPTVVGLIPGLGEVLGPILYVAFSPVLFLFALLAVATLLAGFPVGYVFFPAALAAREGTFLDCVAKAVGYAFARPFLFIWDVVKMAVFAYCLHLIGNTVLPMVVKGMPTLYGLLPDGLHPVAASPVAAWVEKIIRIALRLLTGGFVVAYVFGAGTLIYLNMRLEVDNIGFSGPGPDDPEPGAEA
jgi:hypothetical protein